LSKILLEDMNDERLKFVTITDVELSDDQKYLKVYFSTMPGKIQNKYYSLWKE